MPVRTFLYTGLALIAFAANSVFCRLALAGPAIDPAGFTSIRLLSGAVVLAVLTASRKGGRRSLGGGSLWATAMLVLYAVAFSLAYVDLDTGTGALVLFGSVQVSMVFLPVLWGYRPRAVEWAGAVVAFGGLAFLLWPGWAGPTPRGLVLMVAAGIGWGLYSLAGRSSKDPLGDTAGNFVKTAPVALVLLVVMLVRYTPSPRGVIFACLSGAAASGLGYAVWYAALRGLTPVRAATAQLLVPVIAYAGGVLFLSETVTPRIGLAGLWILGGIFLTGVRKTADRAGP